MNFLLPILWLVAGPALAQLTPEEQARVERLQHKLLAPCCYTESIAEHRSEVALQMREEVRRMVQEGKSDQEILDYYKARYGMRVLAEPEGKLWWWMNIIPAVALLAGLLLVIYLVLKWYRSSTREAQA